MCGLCARDIQVVREAEDARIRDVNCRGFFLLNAAIKLAFNCWLVKHRQKEGTEEAI